MRIFLIIATVFISVNIDAQGFFDGEPKWYIRSTWTSPIEPGSTTRSIVLRPGGVEILNGKEYVVIEESTDSMEIDWSDSGLRLREQGDTIFSYEGWMNKESIYLIRNWETGTSYYPCFESYGGMILQNIDTIINLGNRFTRYEAEWYWLGEVTIIEDVGYKDYMFQLPSLCATDLGTSRIRCLYRNNSLIYSEDGSSECFLPTVITKTEEQDQLNPEVVQTVLSKGDVLRIENLAKGTIAIYRITGELLYTKSYPKEHLELNSEGYYIVDIRTKGNRYIERILVK